MYPIAYVQDLKDTNFSADFHNGEVFSLIDNLQCILFVCSAIAYCIKLYKTIWQLNYT